MHLVCTSVWNILRQSQPASLRDHMAGVLWEVVLQAILL